MGVKKKSPTNLRALVIIKFHDRRVERSKSRLVKPEQESRKEKKKDMSGKVPANTLELSHEQKLENIQKKID